MPKKKGKKKEKKLPSLSKQYVNYAVLSIWAQQQAWLTVYYCVIDSRGLQFQAGIGKD